MIKFLIVVISLTLAYLGLTAVSKYDTIVSILVFDYKINISMVLMLVIIIMLISFSSLGIRLISMIFKMPYILAEKLAGHKKRSRTKAIMDAYGQVVIGDFESAQRIISKIDMDTIDKDYKEHIHLISAICNKDFDKNMPMLQNLLSNNPYHDFAAKVLAQKMYDQGYYAQSLQYAEQIRITTNSNPETMILLINIYIKLDMWDKFSSSIERYIGIYPRQDKIDSNDISNYYVKAAKFTLSEGAEQKTSTYLEKALEYNPINLDAIEMLSKINLTRNRSDLNLNILEQAFSKSPSFAIFELYVKSSNITSRKMYEIFSSLVDPTMHKDVFFAIAAYLGLDDEIKFLKSHSVEMVFGE